MAVPRPVVLYVCVSLMPRQVRDAMDPLLAYLDNNIGVLAEYLYEARVDACGCDWQRLSWCF